jgi:hypothetical protein
MINMTDRELIDLLMKSTKPSDIFTGDWKKLYLQYCKLIHPDSCSAKGAGDAMAKMNYFKDVLENGLQYADETGAFRVFEKRIVYNVTDDNRKLLTKSVANYNLLKAKHDKASESFHRYLPESMLLEKDKLIITLKDRSIPLTGRKLEQVHVNWLFSRMFEFCMWLKQTGYAHIGLNPTTVFVVPETHGIIIISFYHMTELGKKAGTISAKYKMWYPTDLFVNKIATQDIDLELCKKVALYLLGDKSAGGTKLRMDKEVNQQVLDFLLTKHQNEVEEYTQYRELLAKNFERKFYPLNL